MRKREKVQEKGGSKMTRVGGITSIEKKEDYFWGLGRRKRRRGYKKRRHGSWLWRRGMWEKKKVGVK